MKVRRLKTATSLPLPCPELALLALLLPSWRDEEGRSGNAQELELDAPAHFDLIHHHAGHVGQPDFSVSEQRTLLALLRGFEGSRR
jgi:hypothetical protein